MGHILVDFDKTLAFYDTWEKNGANLGHPIPAMVERIKRWLSKGQEVRIFTARASSNNPRRDSDVKKIQGWCTEFLGQPLPITNEKDFETIAIWDDRAVTVEPNTGWRWSAELPEGHQDPLTFEEEAEFGDIALGRMEYAGLKKEQWVASKVD